MIRRGVIGAGLLGVLAASATLASSAAAVEPLPQIGRCVKVATGAGEWLGKNCTVVPLPGKGTYDWLGGAGEQKKFSATAEGPKSGEEVLLETVGKPHRIKCQAGIITGEYTGAQTEKETVLLVGCNLPSTKQKCQTSPAPTKEGEIEFSAEGALGFIRGGERPIAGWDLKAVSASITCGVFPETKISTDELTGSVIAPVKQVPMTVDGSLLYKSVAGKQVPEKFEGGPTDVLSSKIMAGIEMSTEQTGLQARETLESEEPLAIKTKCIKEKLPCT